VKGWGPIATLMAFWEVEYQTLSDSVTGSHASFNPDIIFAHYGVSAAGTSFRYALLPAPSDRTVALCPGVGLG